MSNNLKILGVENKTQWEEFLRSVREKTFLQSWAWGEFHRAMGEQIWRLGIYEAEELIGVCLVVKVNARRGKFLFVPHGPIFMNYELGIRNYGGLVESLKELAKKEKCDFIRISPILEEGEENEKLFKELGFRDAPLHMHAELTWVLDITKSEEDLLAGMRKTTRNLIKRGEREGVEACQGTFDEFYRLYQETEKRQQFVAFSKKYLQKELNIFGDNAQIFLASHQGTILAGAIIVFYDDTIYYHHGASLHSQIPAAYTLQWEIIKQAKKRGMKQYNFWGVAKEDDTKHPWYGLSLFKRGFGGREWLLMHAKDLPLSWSYWISWAIEEIRKRKRRY